jgi:hypothetical protein
MRWTQQCRKTSDTGADGEGVWSWRPDAGAKVAGDNLRMTGAKEPGPRGEHDTSRKTIAQGMPVDCGVPVVANACAFYTCTRGRGCNAHPAFPAPSVLIEGNLSGITRADSCRGNADPYLSAIMPRESGASSIPEASRIARTLLEYWIARSSGPPKPWRRQQVGRRHRNGRLFEI